MNSTDESNHDIMLVNFLTGINAGAGILFNMTEQEVIFNLKNYLTIYKVVR